jgi:hypothetical protein
MYCTLRYKLSNQKTKPFSLCLPGGKFFVFIKDGRERPIGPQRHKCKIRKKLS